MKRQMDLCDPYPAAEAKYEVLELVGNPSIRATSLAKSQVDGWVLVGYPTSDYLRAVEQARARCLLYGKEVWVVDRNDQDWVVFRASPDEYMYKVPTLRVPRTAGPAI